MKNKNPLDSLSGEQIAAIGAVFAKLQPTAGMVKLDPGSVYAWKQLQNEMERQFILASARSIFRYSAHGRNITFFKPTIDLHDSELQLRNI